MAVCLWKMHFNTFIERPHASFIAVSKIRKKKIPCLQGSYIPLGKIIFSSLGPSFLICQNEVRLELRRRISFSS